jgi:hypothetical protein
VTRTTRPALLSLTDRRQRLIAKRAELMAEVNQIDERLTAIDALEVTLRPTKRGLLGH